MKKKIVIIMFLYIFCQLVSGLTIFGAIDKDEIKKLRIFLAENPDNIKQKDKKTGLTLLHKAAAKGHFDICKLLIEKNAEINAIDNSERTPLHLASFNGHLGIVELLIKNGADLLKRDRNGGTCLHFAARGGYPKIIKLFLDKKVDVNLQDNNFYRYTPLIWAVIGNKINSIEELLKHGADLNPSIILGRSPLHFAAQSGDREIIEFLLKNRIKINSKSDYDNTPLFWAIRSRNHDNTKILIEKGANLYVANINGLTPIAMAVNRNYPKIVDLLLKNRVNVKKQNSSGDTHLHAAAYEGHKEMVKLLLKNGVNPSFENEQRLTALDLAISRKHLEVQKLLFSAKAKRGKSKGQTSCQLAEIGEVGPGLKNPVKVTIIYDNYANKKGMKAHWGFSCYIKGTKKNILFDTGTKSELFLNNLKELKIDHNQVDVIVISHEHSDHTGGLLSFLELNHNLSVILPDSFSYDFKSRLQSFGATALTVKDPVEICKDVFCSEIKNRMINEQSLAINTQKGLVIISGCAHSGIINIIKYFKKILKKEVYMVFGGFHIMNKTEQEVNEIIKQMKDLGVRKCGATHCTGDKQIKMFKEAFGDNYVTLGVGSVVTIE